jgi:hypothetical protein
MDTEVLVKESLSGDMIAAGAELSRRLHDAGLVVSATLWLYVGETNTWRFVIGNPTVNREGSKKIYRQVRSVTSLIPIGQPKIDLKDITVTDSKDPLLVSLRLALKNGELGIRFTHNFINGIFIEDSYIYRVN